MEKIFIKNRKGLKMAILVEEAENQKGLVFLMHGFLSFKEHPLITETVKVFKQNNFTTVSFDTTNSLGESEGNMEDGTTTGYLNDLEDLINWSKEQKWYNDKFFLVGHSMGGYCVADYAIRNTNVKSIILFSSKVLGDSPNKAELEDLKAKGFVEWESHSTPGVFKRKGYKYFEDEINHNLLNIAEKIKCPVLIMSGDEDEVIPIEQQKMLFDKIKSKKEIHIFKNSDHNLKGRENSEELYNIINNWIKSSI
jgi:alpha-beta hydrolase superfamily lysophospholipase